MSASVALPMKGGTVQSVVLASARRRVPAHTIRFRGSRRHSLMLSFQANGWDAVDLRLRGVWSCGFDLRERKNVLHLPQQRIARCVF